jgi:hypothetical protein
MYSEVMTKFSKHQECQIFREEYNTKLYLTLIFCTNGWSISMSKY